MPKHSLKPHGTHMHFNWLKPAYLCLSGLGNWDMWRRSVWGTLCVRPAWGNRGPVEVRPNYSPRLQPHNILQLQVSDKVRIKCCRESKVGSVRCGDLSFFKWKACNDILILNCLLYVVLISWYLITLGCIILMLIIHRNVSKQLHQSVSTADISADIFGASRAFFCVYLSVCGYELIMTSLIWQFDYLRTSSSQMFVMRKCYRDLVCIRAWARPYLLMLFDYIEEYVFLWFLYEE